MWKDIEGYEGRYQVSDTGLVKSCEHFHEVTIKGTNKEHNRLHCTGRVPHNKGKPFREVVLKAWKTRKEKMKCLQNGQSIN